MLIDIFVKCYQGLYILSSFIKCFQVSHSKDWYLHLCCLYCLCVCIVFDQSLLHLNHVQSFTTQAWVNLQVLPESFTKKKIELVNHSDRPRPLPEIFPQACPQVVKQGTEHSHSHTARGWTDMLVLKVRFCCHLLVIPMPGCYDPANNTLSLSLREETCEGRTPTNSNRQ